MATTFASLKSINAYPIPAATIEGAALRWGVDLQQELTKEIMRSREYKLCRADLLDWLSSAPNISQGGQTYSFSPEQRKEFKLQAQQLRQENCGEVPQKPIYGYKGSKL